MAKRLLSFGLALLLVTTLLNPPANAAKVKIAISYEVGGKGDNGINDLASVGLERAIKKYKLSKLDIRDFPYCYICSESFSLTSAKL